MGVAEDFGTFIFSHLEHVEVIGKKIKIIVAVLFLSRYAERTFWSIEAIRSEDDQESREECLKNVTAARTIELYFFLQAYLQAIPQILLQLHILMRNVNDMSSQTSKPKHFFLCF